MRRRRRRKKSRNVLKILLSIVGVILIFFVGLVIYFVIKDFGQEDILKQEIINYSNMDLAHDDYTIYVKTTGDYAYIEEAIKKFYKELSDNVKTINYYMTDKDLINILSADNLLKERPDFIKSYAIIEKDKSKVINALNRISKLCEKDTVEKIIDKEKVDDYSYNLYKELMLTKQDIEDLSEIKNRMEYLSKNLNLFFDKEVEILDFLKNNNSSWEYKDNQLYFTTNELVIKYNSLYKELTEIVNKFETDNSVKSGGDGGKVVA